MPDAIERVKAMLARWRDRQAYEEDQIEWFQVSADYAADIAALVARVEKLEAAKAQAIGAIDIALTDKFGVESPIVARELRDAIAALKEAR